VHIGEKKADNVRNPLMDYRHEHFEERDLSDIQDCFPYKDKDSVTWINVDGTRIGVPLWIWVCMGGHGPRRFPDARLFQEEEVVVSELPWMIV